MADGFRNLVINPQERLVSSDANRMQAFAHRDSAEFLRYLLDVTAEDDSAAGAVITEYNAVGTPMRGEIINGLLVRPVGGGLDLTVDAGLVMLLSPDAAPDESDYKYVKNAAVSAGTLAMTANSSGSVRIDVIECQIDATPGLVTATRDVFNTITGTFAAVLLTKEKYGQLVFRVRLGTPGSGMPGSVSGWLPLAVAKVPDGTVTNDTITFWDVRPLINDRVNSVTALSAIPQVIDLDGQLIRNGATDVPFTGVVHATLSGRRVGGLMRRGTPGTDADNINWGDTANQDTGTIVEPLSTGAIYMYLACPFGLPRWSRYTDGPSNRVPRSPRGIPIISKTIPSNFTKAPSSALALPTSTGLGGTTSEAVAICSTLANGVSQFSSLACANRGVFHESTFPSQFTGAYSAGVITFTPADGTFIPANAKAIYVTIDVQITVPATTGYFGGAQFTAYRDNSNTASMKYLDFDLPRFQMSNQTGAPATRFWSSGTIRMPLPMPYPTARTTPRKVEIIIPSGLTTATTPKMKVVGYEV